MLLTCLLRPMVDPQELYLDLTSPLPSFSEAEVRQWAAGRKVFISSTMTDLQAERQQAVATMRGVGADPRFFESFSTSGDPASVYVPEVSRADVVVLILGERYGSPVPNMNGRSATHVEYDAAIEALKPVLVYRKETPGLQREPPLEAFLRQLDAQHVAARFGDASQLDDLLREGLYKRAQTDSLEWVKLGQAVFPATRFQHEGTNIKVYTATRDSQIVSYLRGFAQGYGRSEVLVVGTDVWLTSNMTLTEEAHGRFQREYVLDIEIQKDQMGSPKQFAKHTYTQFGSIGGISGQDFAKAYVKALLFGEPLPDVLGHSFRPQEPERPAFYLPALYAQLKDHQRVDELFPSLGRVYLTDRLVRGLPGEGGVAERIYNLELGPVYNGKTHIRLTYAIAGRIGSNQTEVEQIEGVVVLEQPKERAIFRNWS